MLHDTAEIVPKTLQHANNREGWFISSNNRVRAQIVRCDEIADVMRMGQCCLTSSCSRGNPLLKSRTQSVTICVSMRGYEYEREEGGEDTTVASKNRSIVLACSGKSLSASVKEAHKFVNACSIK